MRKHWFDYATEKRLDNLHLHFDNKTGLHAIIAIHSTKLGPALGGCRFVEYDSVESAIMDALRLSRAMSFKAAMVGLPQGGGKTVLMKPKHTIDREAYFRAFGRFVDSLNGKYITAIDSGSTVADMDIVRTATSHVTSTSELDEDASLYTARGVFIGMKRAIQIRNNTDHIAGTRVAIQGVGSVGYYLANLLKDEGVNLLISDVNEEALKKTADDTGATIIENDAIYDVDCDVFAPCALGATINDKTLPRLKAKIIAGAANNQLAYAGIGNDILEREIFFVPDYVLNAGGLIYCSCHHNNLGKEATQERLENIADSVETVYTNSLKEQRPSNQIVDEIAEKIVFSDN